MTSLELMTRLMSVFVGMAMLSACVACGSDLGLPFPTEHTLRVALPSFGAEVLDPSADSQSGFLYYGPMFDHLLGSDQNGRPSIESGVLEGWDNNSKATEYTLTLKKGIKWHDGVEMTSEDLLFSIGHYSRAAAACATCGLIQDDIEQIKIIGPYQVRIILKEPEPTFITRLGSKVENVPILPAHYWEKVGASGFADSPIGSGPWRFVERVTGEYIEYEANRDYWDSDHVTGFKRLRLLKVPDPQDQLAMLIAGTIDMAPVALRDVETLKAEGFSIQGPRYVKETTLRFLKSYDPTYLTSRLEFRKALILGMNLSSMIEQIYPPEAATQASGSPMFGPLAEGHDPDLPPYPYDPESARVLLRRAGYDGETVHMLSIPVYGLTEIPVLNEMMAADWRRIGVNVEIHPTTYGPVKARFSARPQRFEDLFPAPLFHGGHINRPGGIMNSISRYMTTAGHSLLSYDDLDEGDRIHADLMAVVDPHVRAQQLKALNRRLYEEYWAAPVIWRHDLWALRQGLEGWTPTDGTSSDLHLETIVEGG